MRILREIRRVASRDPTLRVSAVSLTSRRRRCPSVCRGCIVRLSNGARVCPVCGVRTTPPLLPDTRLQRLVYLVVPGLFRSELQRRRHFLVLNPLCPPLPPPLGAINLTLDDFVSLSLEELDETEWEVGENGVLRKRSDVSSACRPWNEDDDSHETPPGGVKARYLKCPAAVTVRHLARLLMLKRGWEETNSSAVNGFSKIEIMYHHFEPCSSDDEKIHLLKPFWTLLDLACIFDWKRVSLMVRLNVYICRDRSLRGRHVIYRGLRITEVTRKCVYMFPTYLGFLVCVFLSFFILFLLIFYFLSSSDELYFVSFVLL